MALNLVRSLDKGRGRTRAGVLAIWLRPKTKGRKRPERVGNGTARDALFHNEMVFVVKMATPS